MNTDMTQNVPSVFDPCAALELLWSKASGNMATHELQWFAEGARAHVTAQAKQMECVLTGLGCLVLNDGQDGTPGVGSFQSNTDVPEMLFMLAGQMSTLAGLSEIADQASQTVLELAEAGHRCANGERPQQAAQG